MPIRNGQTKGVKSKANAGGYAPETPRTAATITLAPGFEDEMMYVRVPQVEQIDVPDGDPIGYTYRAENLTGKQVVDRLVAAGRLSPGAWGMRVEDALNQLAAVEDVDRDNEFSFDTDEFPKPIGSDELTCDDEWAGDLAPEHLVGGGEFPECAKCGREFPELAETEDDFDESFDERYATDEELIEQRLREDAINRRLGLPDPLGFIEDFLRDA